MRQICIVFLHFLSLLSVQKLPEKVRTCDKREKMIKLLSLYSKARITLDWAPGPCWRPCSLPIEKRYCVRHGMYCEMELKLATPATRDNTCRRVSQLLAVLYASARTSRYAASKGRDVWLYPSMLLTVLEVCNAFHKFNSIFGRNYLEDWRNNFRRFLQIPLPRSFTSFVPFLPHCFRKMFTFWRWRLTSVDASPWPSLDDDSTTGFRGK